MQRREMLGALLFGLASACGSGMPAVQVPPGAPRARTRDEARRRLAELGQRYEALMAAHGTHEHSRYAGTLVEGPDARARMEKLRADEREVFEEAKRILVRFGDGIVSPRRAELWRRGALGLDLLGDGRSAELSDELEAVLNAHRFRLDGREISRGALAEMRRSDDPRTRRQVRQLEHELHREAAPIATALLRRRQEVARSLGQRSFWAALLEVRGGSVDTTERVLGELERRTSRAFGRMLVGAQSPRGRLVPSRRFVLPWDLDHRVERAAPVPDAAFPAERALSAAFTVYRAFGIELQGQGLDIRQRDFAFGGQTIAVRIPSDVRLVVRPMPGMRFHGLLLHELGHAVSDRATTETEPLFKGYEWVPGLIDPVYAEGVAEVFGTLLDEPRVLKELLGLSDAVASEVVRARRFQALLGIRRGLVATRFERAASEQPALDLDALSLDVERRHSGTLVPRDAEPVWATSPYLATYPAYVQSYSLAAVMAVQVREALKRRFGAQWISPAAGDWLRARLMSDGARWTLSEKLVRTAGAPLDPVPLLRFVNGQ